MGMESVRTDSVATSNGKCSVHKSKKYCFGGNSNEHYWQWSYEAGKKIKWFQFMHSGLVRGDFFHFIFFEHLLVNTSMKVMMFMSTSEKNKIYHRQNDVMHIYADHYPFHWDGSLHWISLNLKIPNTTWLLWPRDLMYLWFAWFASVKTKKKKHKIVIE